MNARRMKPTVPLNAKSVNTNVMATPPAPIRLVLIRVLVKLVSMVMDSIVWWMSVTLETTTVVRMRSARKHVMLSDVHVDMDLKVKSTF